MRFRSLLVLFLAAAAGAAEPVRFFAMDTAARQAPAEAAAVLAELGYHGFGGRPATAKAFAALSILSAIGILIFALLSALERLLLSRWHERVVVED